MSNASFLKCYFEQFFFGFSVLMSAGLIYHFWLCICVYKIKSKYCFAHVADVISG